MTTLRDPYFCMVRDGTKTIEGRKVGNEWSRYVPGQIVKIVNEDYPEKFLYVEIEDRPHIFHAPTPDSRGGREAVIEYLEKYGDRALPGIRSEDRLRVYLKESPESMVGLWTAEEVGQRGGICAIPFRLARNIA